MSCVQLGPLKRTALQAAHFNASRRAAWGYSAFSTLGYGCRPRAKSQRTAEAFSRPAGTSWKTGDGNPALKTLACVLRTLVGARGRLRWHVRGRGLPRAVGRRSSLPNRNRKQTLHHMPGGDQGMAPAPRRSCPDGGRCGGALMRASAWWRGRAASGSAGGLAELVAALAPGDRARRGAERQLAIDAGWRTHTRRRGVHGQAGDWRRRRRNRCGRG
jgi:hypothetical protein